MSSLPRRLAFFFLALFVAGLMVMFVKQWVHSAVVAKQPAEAVAAKPVEPPLRVLVAKGDIAAGTFLNAEMLSWQEWPRSTLNESYVQQDKAKLEDFIGTVVRSRLTSGEPITAARVVHAGDRGFMAAVLTPGMRAVTVNVTASTGMAGFVSPGDHVDLILTMVVHPEKDKNDDPDRHMSETVLTDIRVLGMDQRISDEKKDVTVPKTATLEVTPKQAEIVAVSADLGLLSLSLRSVAEDDYPPTMHPTWDSEATHLPINLPHFAARKVEIVRGGGSTASATPAALTGSEK